MTPLRQRMIEDMQIRNLSKNTQRAYTEQIARYARHFRRSPDSLGPDDIRSYQVYLTTERKLKPESIKTATAALRFLYAVTLHKDWNLEAALPLPKKPKSLPNVLSREEVLIIPPSIPSRQSPHLPSIPKP